MTLKVAINGFGRIGRNILRAIVESGRTDIEVVAINDLGAVPSLAHLLQFDSVHGRFPVPVKAGSDSIDLGNGPIRVTAIREPKDLPWQGVDIALECTGIFKSRKKAAMLLKSGAKRVLISAPGKNADKTIVYGVNQGILTKDDIIVSNASCTTNCLAPVLKVLDEGVGIHHGFMTTVHSYTGDQPTLDRLHRDLNRGRAAAMNMIPTSTGATKAIARVLPELAGKLDGVAIRVPTPNVSLVDLTFEASRNTTPEEINQIIRTAADGPMQGILAYSDVPNVSVDFNHDPHSSIFQTDQTRVVAGNMVRILTWYDNEWGFSNRMIDTALAMGKFLK
ncbi:MAG: type I glyceraldehyde-3-phosphate dehydrogenase [Rhodobacterales bacterium]|nr:MAG: type I glyceraldehyde-3-phosphate dehydrogenase [Rhodobacterales bacterium]